MKDALLGYNTNVVRLGHVLHVQTEDSGKGRPHVLTHLFAEGTILATKKTEYADIVDVADLADQVRALMRNQHKAMIYELRDGVHDETILRILGAAPAVAATAEEPAPDAGVQGAPAPGPSGSAAPPWPVAPQCPQPAPSGSPPGRRESVPPPPGAGRRAPAPPPSAEAGVEVLGRRAAAERARGPFAPFEDVLLQVGEDGDRSGFGRDLISDRSLDDVILSYLAEEMAKEDK